MKTVRKGSNDPIRVNDIKAEDLVKTAGYEYCPKSEFKALKGKVAKETKIAKTTKAGNKTKASKEKAKKTEKV